MIRRMSSSLCGVVLLAALGGLLSLPTAVLADPVPGEQDPIVAKVVCLILNQYHLNRPEIGDAISKSLFKRFFKDLDPTKVYFLKSDVDEFRKHETELDDQLLKGDMQFAYQVYQRLIQRMGERMKLIEELLKAPQDFTVKEYLNSDFDKIEYPVNDVEVRERWRKRIKYDLLLHRVGQKPLPDAEARQKVLTRYQNLFRYWKQLDNFDLMELYLSALTTSVDPHSTYMSPNTLDDFDVAMRLNLEGIGALLRSENGMTIVAEVYPGGPAAADGKLKANDKIIGVAQGDAKFVDVIDMKLRDVVKLIRGASGTKVELKIIPASKGEPVVYTYTRQKIELKNQEARAEIIEDGKKPDGTPWKIGVIDLPSFYSERAAPGVAHKSATEDVKKLLQQFKAKGVDGVMLDLRHNGGGALSEALALTGLFIDQGAIVQVKGFKGRVQKYDDPERGTDWDGPLVVLISRLSASASEILAGALQDYGRALIVGDSATHGKGTVQQVLDLGSQVVVGNGAPPKLGALKLTIQQFYRVNGDSTQNRGVAADIKLPSVLEVLAPGEEELDHALAFDKVKPAAHDQLNDVPPALKKELQAQSAERIKMSADFQKLLQRIDQVKERKARKQVPLSEAELKAQLNQDDKESKLDPDSEEPPEPAPDKGAYKFTRNFSNNELLAIMEDYLQLRKRG